MKFSNGYFLAVFEAKQSIAVIELCIWFGEEERERKRGKNKLNQKLKLEKRGVEKQAGQMLLQRRIVGWWEVCQ